MSTMTGSRPGIENDINEVANSATGGFISTLADKIGTRTNVQTVFGEAITHGGVTVIPVAKVRWGFGGGGGSGEKPESHESGSGSGGGGGAQSSPLGYIEITDNHAEYRPIKDIASMWPAFLGGAIALYIALSGVRKLFH